MGTREQPEHLYTDGLDDRAPVRARTFQCRETLWQDFQQFAQEDGIGMDKSVESAMVAYARFRGHLEGPTDPRRSPAELDKLAATQDAASAAAALRDIPRQHRSLPAPPPGPSRMPPPNRAEHGSLPPVRMRTNGPPPPTAPLDRPLSPVYRAPPPPMRSAAPPPGEPEQRPRTAPPPMRSAAPPPVLLQSLSVTYAGRRYIVDKDRFTLGRSKQADMRLDDPNVSRHHAAIERVGDRWYAVDQGSTNGILVDGEQVDRRALRDGDVIEITSHRITCRMS